MAGEEKKILYDRILELLIKYEDNNASVAIILEHLKDIAEYVKSISFLSID